MTGAPPRWSAPTAPVDWLCLPRFDSSACFAALLGTEKHGPLAAVPGRRLRGVAPLPRRSAVLETDVHDRRGRRHPHRPDAAGTAGRTSHAGWRVRDRSACGTSGGPPGLRRDHCPGPPADRRRRGGHHRHRGPDQLVLRPATPDGRRPPTCRRVRRRRGRRVLRRPGSPPARAPGVPSVRRGPPPGRRRDGRDGSSVWASAAGPAPCEVVRRSLLACAC